MSDDSFLGDLILLRDRGRVLDMDCGGAMDGEYVRKRLSELRWVSARSGNTHQRRSHGSDCSM